MKITQSLPPLLTPDLECAIDCEIFQMTAGKLHRPTGHFASIQICFDGNEVFVIQDEKQVPDLLKRIEPATHLFHNAYFDIFHIRRWGNYPDRQNLYCTLLLEKILWGGYYDSFGLKDLARRYLSIYMDKKEREEFVTADEFTPKMLKYAADDPLITWKIFQEQKKLINPEVERVWKEIDQPALYAVLDFKGMNFDTVSWTKVAETAKVKVDELAGKMDFNPNSPAQVLRVLRDSGLKKLTSTNEKELMPYKEYPLVQQILEYRENYKKVSTYGLKFIESHVEEDGRIYPEFNVTEATSGRMSSSSPNVQNIPNTKEYRSCFIASKDNVILDMDYAAQEPRITASLSGDKTLIESVHSGKNVHIEVGKRMFKVSSITKSSPLYKKAKAINLGLTYGMTAKGLFININNNAETEADKITLDEAQELINQYFNTFWNVKQWIDAQRIFAQKHGYVQTRSGRRMWINRSSFRWGNNSINMPVQGGAADVTKLALSKFRTECQGKKLPYPVIAVVHDEIVCDVPKDLVQTYEELLKTSMISVAEKLYPEVRFEVEIATGSNWGIKS